MISIPDQYSNVEIVVVDICTSTNYKHRITYICNPPIFNLDRVNSMCACLKGITNVTFPVSIFGDFNFPEIDWINMELGASIAASLFLSQIRDLGLKQIVTAPTRGDNLLDIILCNNPMNLLTVSVVEPIANCDHKAILFKMWCQALVITYNCNIRYHFYNVNFGSFSNYSSSINWGTVFINCNSTNECWLNFKTVLQKEFPILILNILKNQNLKPTRPPYICKKLIKKKLLWRKYRQPGFKNFYKKQAAKCCHLIEKYNCKKELNLITNGNVKQYFHYVNKKMNSLMPVAPLKMKLICNIILLK